jgi:hypothetical protein
MCHIPSFAGGVEPLEGESLAAHSLNFKDLIHGVHANSHYPDTLADCARCHEGDTQSLPVALALLPSLTETHTCGEALDADADDECDPATLLSEPLGATSPETAACVGCHSAPSTLVHAEVNTSPTSGAEACATCHGNGKNQGVDVVHGR